MPFKYTHTFAENGELILWEITETVRWFHERMTLSPTLEREFRQIQVSEKRQQWMASRFALQQLARTAVLDVIKDTFGKPHFVNDNRFISISHCRGLAAAISASVPVGVDVEIIHSRVQRIRDRFLSANEQLIVGNTDADLMLAWSAKEAVYKMYGEKGLIFKEDICIQKRDDERAALTVRLCKGELDAELTVHYKRIDECVLSWVFNA